MPIAVAVPVMRAMRYVGDVTVATAVAVEGRLYPYHCGHRYRRRAEVTVHGVGSAP